LTLQCTVGQVFVNGALEVFMYVCMYHYSSLLFVWQRLITMTRALLDATWLFISLTGNGQTSPTSVRRFLDQTSTVAFRFHSAWHT